MGAVCGYEGMRYDSVAISWFGWVGVVIIAVQRVWRSCSSDASANTPLRVAGGRPLGWVDQWQPLSETVTTMPSAVTPLLPAGGVTGRSRRHSYTVRCRRSSTTTTNTLNRGRSLHTTRRIVRYSG